MGNVLQWFLTGRSGQYIATAAVFLAGVCFVAVIWSGFTIWHRQHMPRMTAVTVQLLPLNADASTHTSPSDLHLFGVGLTPEGAQLPRTHLELELTGIMAGEGPESSFMAIIATSPGGPGQVYRVGDTLPGLGVKVQAITREDVVLENGGHFERLNLQRSTLHFESLSKQSILGG